MRTTIVSEQPEVFLIASEGIQRDVLVNILSTQNVKIVQFSEIEILEKPYVLQQAYKIIWVNLHTTITPAFEKIVNTLSEIKSLDVVQPLLTPIQTSKNSLFSIWDQHAQQQQRMFEYCNSLLVYARFFIIKDCIDISSHSPFLFMVQRMADGVIVYPDVVLTPQRFEDAARGVLQKFFDPRQKRSILVHGSKREGVEIATILARQYESYHGVALALQIEHCLLLPIIEFRCDELFLPVDIEETCSVFSRALPSPKSWGRVKKIIPLPESPKTIEAPEFESKKELKKELVEKIKNDPSPIYQNLLKVRKKILSKSDSVGDSAEESNLELNGINQDSNQDQDRNLEFDQENQKTITLETTQPSYQFNLSNEIHALFSSTHLGNKSERKEKVVKVEKKIIKKTKKNTVLFYGGMFFTGVGLGVLALLGVFYLSLKSLEGTLTEVVVSITGDEPLDSSLWKTLGTKERIVEVQAESYGALFSTPWISEAESFLKAGDLLRDYEETRFKANESLNLLVSQFLGNGVSDAAILAENVSANAQKQYDLLSELESQLQMLPIQKNIDSFQKTIETFSDDLISKRKFLLIQQQLKPILSSLSGEKERRQYAILLQNNQELRPTGGFLQAIAIITYENGALVTTQVYRTSELDQKIDGSVIPPKDITRFLGEERWFLSDSNWDPHFPATAEQIKWFIDKTLNIQLDGVIGLDLYALQDILEAIGPVDIPEYNETITHKNLLERMEFHSEVVLVDSAQNKEYSEILLERILQNLQTVSGSKISQFLSALSESLMRQDMLVTFFKEEEQAVFKSVGWTGGLLEPQCPNQLVADSCLVDTIAQVDANVGVNKANYYLQRGVEHTVSLNTDGAHHIRRVEYRNTAESNAWPKGSYKNYARFYLSENSVFESVIVDGEKIKDKDLFLGSEYGRVVVGVKLEIPIQQTSTLELRYSTPFTPSEEFSYALFNQKQPGTKDEQTRVLFTYNESFSPTLIAPQALLIQDTIVFSEEENKHGFFGTKFVTQK